MRKTAILFPVIIAAMASCSGPERPAETAKPADSTATTAEAAKPAPPKMDSAAMAKMMMEAATPGEMHKMMASLDGKWDAEVTSTWDPSKPPAQSKGTEENKMIMGGRYQQSIFKGEMMGMPFEGMSMLAYDNTKKVFVNTWIDNMGTGMMVMEGPYDAATKTITLKGKMTDPSTGGDCAIRQTMKMEDDKHQTMDMYSTPAGGQEMKVMTIKYTKK